MAVTFSDIERFANDCLEQARNCAETIHFPERGMLRKSATIQAESGHHIASNPRFLELNTYQGVAGWAVALSVDMRKSSRRAVKEGVEKTYLTMHTFLPTMAELVFVNAGKIGGLRGDGLFAG